MKSSFGELHLWKPSERYPNLDFFDVKGRLRPGVVLISSQEVRELELKFDYNLLYKETLDLEGVLQDRARKEGYMIYETVAEEEENTFAHILEHAILAVIDYQLNPGVSSTGCTRNAGIDKSKPSNTGLGPIHHGKEIYISPAGTIPPAEARHCVYVIINQMLDNYEKYGEYRLRSIIYY